MIRLFLVLCAVGGAATTGHAQPRPPVRPVPTPTPRPTTTVSPGTRRDTTRAAADSMRADSTGPRQLIKWAEADSMTAALLARQGYSITRYQGVKVTFNAKSRTLYLEGKPAGVGRGATVLIGDTITYNDSTKVVLALREMRYNVESRRGTVLDISTSVESGEKWFVHGSAAAFVNDTTRGRSTRFYAKNGSITSCD